MEPKIKVVAEIGTNWVKGDEGTLSDLKDALGVVSGTGAYAAKLQIGLNHLYSKQRAPVLWERMQKNTIPLSWLPELKEKAYEYDVKLCASVFDASMVDDVARYVDILKIASGDLVYEKMVNEVCVAGMKYGNDVYLSTGGATSLEVETVVIDITKKLGFPLDKFVLMKCNSEYPAKPENAKLASMVNLANEHFLRIGYSDHTVSTMVPAIVAVGLGYEVFEKHINPFELKTNPDSSVSLNPAKFRTYVENLKIAWKAMGTHAWTTTSPEKKERLWARRGMDEMRPTDEVGE